MLANIARESKTFETAASWESAYCWHFTSGQYILHTLTNGTLHYPGANNMTIAFWWKKPIISGAHWGPNACIPIGLKAGTRNIMGLVGAETDSGSKNLYLRVPRNSSFGTITYGLFPVPYYSDTQNDDCPSGSDLWDNWVFTTLSYTHSGDARINTFVNNACYASHGPMDVLGSNCHLLDVLGGDNNIQIGGDSSFYIRELGIWHTALDESNKTALYNNGSPIDFKTDVGNYNQSSSLKAYWRFGDGTGDNPANHLNDEENDGSTIDMDLTGAGSFYGTISQIPVSSAGATE